MYEINKNSSYAIDAVRGVSAQLVLVGHSLSFFGFYTAHPKLPIIQNLGVVIFFILSGFLIISTILRRGDGYSFKDYFIDRFSRIYVAYIPALIFVLLMDRIFLGATNEFTNQSDWFVFAGNTLMFQNHPLINAISPKEIEAFGSGRPFWTVAIEWWIYLLVGFVFIYLKTKKLFTPKNLFLFLLVLIVPLYNIIGRGQGLVITWIFGALVVYFATLNVKYNSKYILLLMGICCVAWLMRTLKFSEQDQYDMGISFIAAVFFLLLLKLAEVRNWATDMNKHVKSFFILIANYSYSLYLVHYTIIIILGKYLPKNQNVFVQFAILFFTSNIIAFIFYSMTEKHTYRFKNFLKNRLP